MAVALYARVSTSRQAEKDLSIPDQLRQMRDYCGKHKWVIGEEYVEDGASATSDRRPVFQAMLAEACTTPPPFEFIVVHSLSRFFRDAIELGLYERKLGKFGVRLVSISQETPDDAGGLFMRRIFSMFDEYQSLENSKHTLRAMVENARQGFWNGAPPPYGYRAIETDGKGRHGKKKKLDIDPTEAEVVRTIYDIYSGRTALDVAGTKGIAAYLNAKGILRRGKAWTGNRIFDVLNNPIYQGELHFNRLNGKTKKLKPRKEWITVAVPAIVTEGVRAHADAVRSARRPSNCPPRQLSSPLLLAGLLRCGVCGAGMTLATGKSGRYRYYRCNNRMNHGKTRCDNAQPRVDALDKAVLTALADQVLAPTHLSALLQRLQKRLDNRGVTGAAELKLLKDELASNKAASDRLFDAVEKGILPPDDALHARAQKLRTQRQEVLLGIARASNAQAVPVKLLNRKNVDAFSVALRDKLLDPASGLSRRYLRLLVDRVTLERKRVTITGSNAKLAAVAEAHVAGRPEVVPSYVPKWLPFVHTN
ncbi:MAG TPA: recombinase family protein [Rudaea sp.]|jgi:DNA invertase Pin-like site-specific DNA recombinase